MSYVDSAFIWHAPPYKDREQLSIIRFTLSLSVYTISQSLPLVNTLLQTLSNVLCFHIYFLFSMLLLEQIPLPLYVVVQGQGAGAETESIERKNC